MAPDTFHYFSVMVFSPLWAQTVANGAPGLQQELMSCHKGSTDLLGAGP